MGVDVVFNWDHFYPLYGEPDGKHYECWTMLGAWAEQTSRVEIGALVTCNSYRNPELLADMARTVDNMSDGRLILGIGSGWFERDYDEYGYEFGTAGGRLNQLGEDLPRIESRWGKLNPPPTRKIPVLIGGGGEKKTLRLVAQHADIWHSFSDLETLKRKTGILHQHCADVGRDPAEIELSVGTPRGNPAEAGPPLHRRRRDAVHRRASTVRTTTTWRRCSAGSTGATRSDGARRVVLPDPGREHAAGSDPVAVRARPARSSASCRTCSRTTATGRNGSRPGSATTSSCTSRPSTSTRPTAR